MTNKQPDRQTEIRTFYILIDIPPPAEDEIYQAEAVYLNDSAPCNRKEFKSSVF